MDRGLWISWYDLDDANKNEYLSWLHERYLPGMLKRPGVQWAGHFEAQQKPPPARLNHTTDKSVPTGNQYIIVIGADTAHAFAPPRPGEKFDEVTDSDGKMSTLRKNERVSIMVEEARTEGPASSSHSGAGLTRCIQLGSFNPGPGKGDDEELLTWYARWRLPCMAKLPGLVRVRELVGAAGWARHGVLYEFTSMEERNKHFPEHEQPYPEIAAWSDKVVRKLMHAPGSPNVAQRIWPK